MSFYPVPLSNFLGVTVTVASALNGVRTTRVVRGSVGPDGVIFGPGANIIGVVSFNVTAHFDQAGPAFGDLRLLRKAPTCLSPRRAKQVGQVLSCHASFCSLNMAFCRLLAKRLPFPADSLLRLIRYRVTEPPAPPRRLGTAVPRPISSLVLGLVTGGTRSHCRDT